MLYAYKTPEGEVIQETVSDAVHLSALYCARNYEPVLYEEIDEISQLEETHKKLLSLGFQRVEVKAVEV